jgi:hypothetical protein
VSVRKDELIDFLLGELPEERAREVEAALAEDPTLREELAVYDESVHVIRLTASEGWNNRPWGYKRRRRLYRAAAILFIAVSVFLLARGNGVEANIYEPDLRLGYLRAEETDSAGHVPVPAAGRDYVVREGNVVVSPFSSPQEFPLKPGDRIAPESEVSVVNGDAVRIDLPKGGILFLGPLSIAVLRERDDGHAAVRLISGVAALVAGDGPVHVAVDHTDLLIDVTDGACLARHSPSEVVCLRGSSYLRDEQDKRFRIPEAHRLPANCAHAPETRAVTDDELDLDWYRSLVYRSWRVEPIEFNRLDDDFVARLEDVTDETLLYLRVVPTESGDVELGFGGESRSYPVRKDHPFRLRIKLAALGDGPRLRVAIPGHDSGLKEARLFDAVPR